MELFIVYVLRRHRKRAIYPNKWKIRIRHILRHNKTRVYCIENSRPNKINYFKRKQKFTKRYVLYLLLYFKVSNIDIEIYILEKLCQKKNYQILNGFLYNIKLRINVTRFSRLKRIAEFTNILKYKFSLRHSCHVSNKAKWISHIS